MPNCRWFRRNSTTFRATPAELRKAWRSKARLRFLFIDAHYPPESTAGKGRGVQN